MQVVRVAQLTLVGPDLFFNDVGRRTEGDRYDFRHDGIHVSLFGSALPVIESVNGNGILTAPVFDGEPTVGLFLEPGGPLEKISLVKRLTWFHEYLLLVARTSWTTCVRKVN